MPNFPRFLFQQLGHILFKGPAPVRPLLTEGFALLGFSLLEIIFGGL